MHQSYRQEHCRPCLELEVVPWGYLCDCTFRSIERLFTTYKSKNIRLFSTQRRFISIKRCAWCYGIRMHHKMVQLQRKFQTLSYRYYEQATWWEFDIIHCQCLEHNEFEHDRLFSTRKRLTTWQHPRCIKDGPSSEQWLKPSEVT